MLRTVRSINTLPTASIVFVRTCRVLLYYLFVLFFILDSTELYLIIIVILVILITIIVNKECSVTERGSTVMK